MLWWIAQNVVLTAALALVVAMVCRFGRLGPVTRHALWVLVLVKFVTPPLVVWPWAVPDPFGFAVQSVTIPADPPSSVEGSTAVVRPAEIQPDAGRLGLSSPLIAEREFQLLPWLLALWILGSISFLTIEVVRLARLARRVRTALPADDAIAGRVADLAARLGLRSVPVLVMSGITSPMIWCFGRPRMLWPLDLNSQLTSHKSQFPVALDGILIHELAHVKRRDHFVGWLELAAGVIWWWNPLFWYVRAASREQAELACDAWVISALPNGRRAYAESLLALSGATVRGGRPISMAAVIGIRAGSRRVLERRLVMIMQGRAPLRLSLAGLLSLIIVAALSLPAWAIGSDQAAQAPAPAIQATTPVPAAQTAPARPSPQILPSRTHTMPHPQVAHPATTHPTELPAPAKAGQRPAAVRPESRSQRPAIAQAVQGRAFFHAAGNELPEEGKKLLQSYEADRDAIQAEADKKLEERRASLIKQLQALQDQFTKAGKLDEALAVRDYIRSGAAEWDHQLVRWIRR